MSDKDKPGQLDEILRRRKELDDLIDNRFKRSITILFTDIVDSTAFFSTRGDIEGRLMIRRHNDLLVPLVSQHRGNLINIIGDALLASFEEPFEAVSCAVKMQAAMAQDNQRRPEQDRVQVRIGIHRGPGFVENGSVYGIVLHLAERIKSLAAGAEILISEPVYRSLQPGRDPLCLFLDKVRVKGQAEEIKVYGVMWRPEAVAQHRVVPDADVQNDLILEVSREDRRIKVAGYERGEGGPRTLRPYEDLEVNWGEIDAACREIIGLLNRTNRRARVAAEILEDLKKSGQILFDSLIPPKAKQKLSGTRAKNLVLYVDDKLVHIPWELLFNGRDFLCRRFAMGRIVSTRQAPTSLSTRSLKAPFKVLVLADPRGDLDASYREGIGIKDFLDEKRETFHVDFKSHPVDIAFVKKNLRDYDIVHYAGHADYSSANPSDSGWLLDDGRLKASEVSAMGGLQPMPCLVFSNACQTGETGEWQISAGYEQEIFGLGNAYLLAGVRHYIGTFWEILDEPSAYFARLFYGLLARGESIGEAIRRARQGLIDDYGEETIVWASYMLYGDPTFAFASIERETHTAAPIPEVAPLKSSPAMRGAASSTDSVLTTRRVRSFRFLYLILATVVPILAIFGYYLFNPMAFQRLNVAFTPASLSPSPTSRIETEIENPEVQQTTEAKKSVTQGRPEKTQTSISKESLPFNTAMQKEGFPLPGVGSQESIPQLETKEGVALNKQSPAAVAVPLTLSMNIIGQRKESDGRYTEVSVTEGSVLRSHDNLQIHLETNGAAYLYVLLYDSQGKASQIFPDPKTNQHGFFEGKLVVPAKDLWFWLDENTGTETIYVLASQKPMSDIQGLLAKMEAADGAGKRQLSQQIRKRIIERGVAVVEKGKPAVFTLSDGKKVQKVTELVTGTGSVVRAVSFYHR